MRRIVILEDNYYEAEDLINDISFELGHKEHYDISPEWAKDIDELNEKLFDKRGLKEDYKDCIIILDLLMDPDGLNSTPSDEEILFTGWCWLIEKQDILDFSKQKVIFYSAYVDDFKSTHKDDYSNYFDSGKAKMLSKANDGVLLNELRKYLQANI